MVKLLIARDAMKSKRIIWAVAYLGMLAVILYCGDYYDQPRGQDFYRNAIIVLPAFAFIEILILLLLREK